MITILEYLCPQDEFNLRKADEMCLYVKKYAESKFKLEDNAAKALYRFSILTFSYLDKECNREDFNFLAFFKILYSEILDKSFRTKDTTVFDILIDDAEQKGYDTIYIMSKYWYEVHDKMPENADEMYQYGFVKFCQKKEIEFDESDMKKAKDCRLSREKYDEAVNNDTLVQFFVSFSEFRRTGERKYLLDAENIIERLEMNSDAYLEIYNNCISLLNEYRVYNPVLKLIKDNFKPRFVL